jgi:hypothetical protein
MIMHDPKHPGEPAHAAGAGHEESDLQPRVIATFGVVLAVTVIVCLVVAVWIFNFLTAREAKQDVPPSPLAKIAAPSEPRLQVAAPTDLARFRAAEEKILTTYDWADRQAGTVRIPIDRAIQLLLERGLPAAQKETGASTTGRQSRPTKAKRP